MATLQWDHTVHYVNDIEKAKEIFLSNGLRAFIGGSHTQWGTHNALSHFGLNYIEFLGVENEEMVKNFKEPNQLVKDSVKWLPEHEILSRVAIRTDDITSTAAFLKNHDLDCSPIMDGKRRNAQGKLMEWKMVTVAGGFQGLDYPFFIQWGESDQERYKSLQDIGAIKEHPAGNVIVKEAIFQVTNPAEVATCWSEIFRLPILDINKSINEAKLAIGDERFIFQQGTANRLIEIVLHTDSPMLKGKTVKIGEGSYIFK